MAKDDQGPRSGPNYNDDSQPSVTNPTQALKLADEASGVTAAEAAIPAPADAIDLAYRTALADVDAVEVGKAVAAKQEAGVPDEEIDVEAMGEGDDDAGSGPYEGRTAAQLRNAAKAKGLASSGSKDELVARLRG
jgi:hypothetical protein